MLSISPIEAFSDNYIWLLHNEEGKAAVVDPGDAAPVLAALAERGLSLEAILVTHHHFDHTGGIAGLLESCPVPVYGPHNPQISTVSQPLRAGARIDVLGDVFEVFEVPGHTLDHIAYYRPATATDAPLLFSGDTLFAGGCGRLFEGSAEMMYRSLAQFASLPAETRVYCAHEYTLANLAFARAAEPCNSAIEARLVAARATRETGAPTVPSTIADELATNPFMRSDTIALQQSLAEQGHLASPEGSLQQSAQQEGARVLAAVRSWKDNF